MVDLNHQWAITIPVVREAVLDLLHSPPWWGPLQPHVLRVTAEPDGCYRWEFEEMVVVGVRLPLYRVRLIERGPAELAWEPVSADEYRCSGTWRLISLRPHATHLGVEVALGAEINIPAPFLVALKHAVRTIFARQIDQLLANLQAYFAVHGPG